MNNELIATYQERRQQLADKLDISTNAYLKELTFHALIITDLSIQTISEDLPLIIPAFTQYLKSQHARYDALAARAKSVFEDANKYQQSGFVLDETQLKTSLSAIEHTKATLQNLVTIHDIEAQAFQTSIILIPDTLNLLFKATNRKDLIEAVQALGKFVLELTTIGPAIELITTLRDIKAAYILNEKKTDETLNFLIKYIEKCYLWNMSSQIILEYHKRNMRGENEKISCDDVAKLAAYIIQERFKTYLERLNKDANIADSL